VSRVSHAGYLALAKAGLPFLSASNLVRAFAAVPGGRRGR
jgi:hypothetical protein